MKKKEEQSFLEFVEKVFYNFSQSKLGSIKILFSKKSHFPIIRFEPELEMVVPLPQKQDGKYVFEGMVFDNNQCGRKNLWCLFLATIYHLSAHAIVSRYSTYDAWRTNKTEDICSRIIDFIEDVYVEKYIAHTDSEIWDNIKHIDRKLLLEEKSDKSYKKHDLKIYDLSKEEKIKTIKKKLLDEPDKALLFADLLYKNRELLSKKNLPYCEQHCVIKILKTENKSPNFEPFGSFLDIIEKLDELWLIDENNRFKLLKKYEKHLKGLNFDSITIPQGNFHNYTKMKENILPLLKRIRQQIRFVANLEDDPRTDQIGQIDMQMAIQSIASEGHSTDIFERDETRRAEEAWAILVDKSASMSLRFDQIKEFTVCVSESANDLTGKVDAWALFSFDNNFQILKDFKEEFGPEVQARIGALENSGLSLLPDAIELTCRILAQDPREKKYIFVITDGHPSGYARINEQLSKIIKKLNVSGITLIAIGVSKSTSKRFKNSVKGTDLKQLVAKFITAYKTVSSGM